MKVGAIFAVTACVLLALKTDWQWGALVFLFWLATVPETNQ